MHTDEWRIFHDWIRFQCMPSYRILKFKLWSSVVFSHLT